MSRGNQACRTLRTSKLRGCYEETAPVEFSLDLRCMWQILRYLFRPGMDATWNGYRNQMSKLRQIVGSYVACGHGSDDSATRYVRPIFVFGCTLKPMTVFCCTDNAGAVRLSVCLSDWRSGMLTLYLQFAQSAAPPPWASDLHAPSYLTLSGMHAAYPLSLNSTTAVSS